jgi:DNA mismatch repair protein MutS
MVNTNDLHIENEVRSFFDVTHNVHSASELSNILSKVLDNKEQILERQHLLKGFILNHHIFKDYSHYRFDLTEVFDFLETIFIGNISPRKLRFKLRWSEKERERRKGRLILMVRIFYALNQNYFSRIDLSKFPPIYASELEFIKKFFSDLDLEYYEKAFEKKKFRVNQIVSLMLIISSKIATGEMAGFWKRWFLFEAYLSISHCIATKGLVFPEFDDKNFELIGIYHPALKDPVKNDLTINKPVTLLSGPNMSGKSTLLKSVSICVYLAHAGLAVPATKAVMPFFNSISVAINLTDSIVSGYSHFMTEVMTLKNVVADAEKGYKCFAVFDELFRGTNIEDAFEISRITIRGLCHFSQCIFLISTHLHHLKEMDEIKNAEINVWSIECTLNNNHPLFTYKLKEGWNDLKLGKILFENEGLDLALSGAIRR